MTAFTPSWRIKIQGIEYTDVTLANLSVTSGREDIYRQPVAGYCTAEILNFNAEPIVIDVNDGITIELLDSSSAYVPIFGGFISDLTNEITASGSVDFVQTLNITALGALSKLPVSLWEGSLSQDYEGDQIYEILSGILLGQWNEVSPSITWATYDATETWANAVNQGLGTIDQPGNYEMVARSASTIDVYTIVADLASSGLGYIYEDAQGNINYADSTHRSSYLATNGYTEISAGAGYAVGTRIVRRLGDIRNSVVIYSGNNFSDESADTDPNSIASYGTRAFTLNTYLKHKADAEAQAQEYMDLRAWPQNQLGSITFPLTNPNIDNTDRDALVNIFMGMPIKLTNLPANMNLGQFEGFVEGWNFRAGYNSLNLSIFVSPTAFSLRSMKWNDVGVLETWNTINNTLEWEDATIVA